MTVGTEPVCATCKWWWRNRDGKRDPEVQALNGCSAFPQGVHPDVWWGNNDHSKAIKGDGGFRYVKFTRGDVADAPAG